MEQVKRIEWVDIVKYMLNNPNTHQNCEKCLGGHFVNCMKGKCIHGSTAKSAIGMMEAEFWKWKGTYKYIDTMICCSEFMKTKMDSNPLFATKTVAMHNFIDKVEWRETSKKDYVLYFGRFSEEKGIGTLIKVCKELPDVQFVFAGTGPLEETVNGVTNIKNVGFQKGEALEKLIREARFSIYPSEWYENCPFSVMESQMYGTPVLGANIGGISELIQVGKTGELFESGNAEGLKKKIEKLWSDKKLCAEYSAKPYVEIIANIIMNVTLIKVIGIDGVIIATIISMLFVAYPWETVVFFKHRFEIYKSNFYRRQILHLLITLILAIITYLACELTVVEGIIGFLVKGLICIILPNTVVLLLFHRNADVKRITSIGCTLIKNMKKKL